MTTPATIHTMPLPELTGWRAGLILTRRSPSGPELVAFKDRCRALGVTPSEVERDARRWIAEQEARA